MDSTRRRFIQSSLATAAGMFAASAPFEPFARGQDETLSTLRPSSLKILILGGTQFLGPATVDAAQARGHTLTLFNRGRTEKRKGISIENVEKLYGNRDPNLPADESKNEAGEYLNPSPKGLDSIADAIKSGKKWDVVIDTSGYYPRMVKASAELLAPHVKHYIFISTISAYKEGAPPESDETFELAAIADPTVETMGEQFENYGALKALCEQAAEAALPGRTAIVRPGFIVGPQDPTDRFTFWPVRIDRGGEMIVPGDPTDPIQIIDVRDLGEWLIKLAEQAVMGVFNAVGPNQPLTMKQMVEGCRAGVESDAKFTWIPAEFLKEQAVEEGAFPLWIPPEGEYAGFHRWSNAKAVKAGLKFRPVAETAKDTLEWFRSQPAERQEKLRAGLSTEREAELLKAWRESAAKP